MRRHRTNLTLLAKVLFMKNLPDAWQCSRDLRHRVPSWSSGLRTTPYTMEDTVGTLGIALHRAPAHTEPDSSA